VDFPVLGRACQQNMSNSAPWYSAITATLRKWWLCGESSLKWYFKQVHLGFWCERGKIVCNSNDGAELMISETGDDSSKNTTHKIQPNIGGSCAATCQS